MTALILGVDGRRCELRATTDFVGKNARLFAPQRRHRNAENTEEALSQFSPQHSRFSEENLFFTERTEVRTEATEPNTLSAL